MRTWLLCLTLVDEVCLCPSVLTCRKRDTAYSKINTQSRRERQRGRERPGKGGREKKEEGGGGGIFEGREERERGIVKKKEESAMGGSLNT